MIIQNPNNRRSVFRTLSGVCAVVGVPWSGSMIVLLYRGFVEPDGYHKREFDEALPELAILTMIGFVLLITAWFFWRASRRIAIREHDNVV